jgi:hypothetical protein
MFHVFEERVHFKTHFKICTMNYIPQTDFRDLGQQNWFSGSLFFSCISTAYITESDTKNLIAASYPLYEPRFPKLY